MSRFVVFMSILTLATLRPAPQSQDNGPRFSLTIATAQQTIKTGSDVIVNISLTNVSGRTVTIIWPGEQPRDRDYLMNVIDDATGKMPPRTAAGRDIFERQPGIIVGSVHLPNKIVQDRETLTQKLTVTKFFDLSKPGKYTVQLQRGKGESAAKSNTISIVVTS